MQPRETPEVARIREDSCVSRSYTRWAPIASVAAIAAISPLAASAPAGTGGVSGRPGGERALRLLSRSAEAYLRTWRRAATGG
jgi:hypothetical protein